MTAPALLLDRSTIASLMTPADYLTSVEDGFRALAEGRADSPPPLHIAAQGGGFHAKGAILRGDRAVAVVKLNANFPRNPARGLPTIQGVVALCDAVDGRLLALLDSAEITLRRTAAASAFAASRLASPDARVLALCGCGAQAVAQVEAIAAVRPIRSVLAWDIDQAKAEALARSLAAQSGLDVRAVSDLAEATLPAEVIVTCTTSQTPFLAPDLVGEGTFVAAVGTDSPDKSEIAPALMARSRVVVDSLEQCLAMGDLRHAVAAGAMPAEGVRGTLADLAAGALGPSDGRETWIFDSTGTAVQDVATAWTVFQRAEEAGVGVRFDFAA